VAPLRELVAALPNAAISVEIPNDELRSWLGVDGYFSLLHRAATEFLQADVTAR
jgi:hypothetical protein